MRKICFVINNRANYARIKSTLAAVRTHPTLELQVIVGNSALMHRYGRLKHVMKQDSFEADYEIHTVVEGDEPISMVKTTALTLNDLGTAFSFLEPDIVVTIADRYETIAGAIAASYMNIVLAHTQGGEVSGSVDESVRHAITKLAHVHFPATLKARQNLIQLGENPRKIFLTGCPSIDLLRSNVERDVGEILTSNGGVGHVIDETLPYILVSQHPDTLRFDDAVFQVTETLLGVTQAGMQAVWLWPNVDAGGERIARTLRGYRETKETSLIRFYKNFSPEDYATLLKHCACIVGNSSSGLREAGFLGVPSVNVGDRQRGRERPPNVLDVPYDRLAIQSAVLQQSGIGRFKQDFTYGDGYAGTRMAEALATVDLNLDKELFANT